MKKKNILIWVIAAVLSLVLYGNISGIGQIQESLENLTGTSQSTIQQNQENETNTNIDINDTSSSDETEITEQESTSNTNTGTTNSETEITVTTTEDFSIVPEIDLKDIPAFTDKAYYEINGNVPFFTVAPDFTESFEVYTELDELGRCGVVYANIGQDLMPTGERGSISHVKPTGWHSVKYDFVDGKSLYNRCHLIGWQLTAEDANKQNLITGTRYLNVTGMLPFENMIADYVKETGNHVMYRVTPIFEGDNLVAHGVLMEGWSVEDSGEGVCFNVYAYNNQPGVVIDYPTGDNWAE